MANGIQTVEDLGKLVKSKYPQYDQMPDAEVGAKVKSKYPQYSSFMDMPAGSEKTGLPGVPSTKLPKALDPTYKQPYSFVNPPEGMIRSGLREATYGAAEGNPTRAVMGGLKAATPAMIGAGIGEVAAAPLTTLARGAIGLGAGEAAKWGAHKLGAGETASDVIGVVAGLLAQSGVPKEEVLRKLWRFRDVPDVQDAAMKVFTGWKSKLLPGRKQEAVTDLESALSKAEAGPAPPAPKAPEPFKPNPSIARKIRGTPGEEPGGGKSFLQTPRRVAKLPDMPESKLRTTGPRYPTPESAARSVKADKIAALAKGSGVDPNLLESAGPAQRKMLAKAAGFDDMSEQTLKQVVEKLRE